MAVQRHDSGRCATADMEDVMDQGEAVRAGMLARRGALVRRGLSGRCGVAGGALAALLLIAGQAQARPDSTAMSCRDAAALVARQGAVVMSTGPNTFDRYVSQVRYCAGGEELKPEWVRTRDVPQCFIGYTCYVPSRDTFNGR